jgi:hypothetical protein
VADDELHNLDLPPSIRVRPQPVGTLSLGSAPALAATDPEEPGTNARVWAFIEDMTVAPAGAPAKDFRLEVITSEAVNPRVVLDVSGLIGLVSFAWPAGCTTQGTVATCPAPPGSVDNNAPLFIPVTAVAGAPAGAQGTIRVRGDADNPGDGSELMNSETVITVSGDGPDLAGLVDGQIPDAKVGDRVYGAHDRDELRQPGRQGRPGHRRVQQTPDPHPVRQLPVRLPHHLPRAGHRRRLRLCASG